MHRQKKTLLLSKRIVKWGGDRDFRSRFHFFRRSRVQTLFSSRIDGIDVAFKVEPEIIKQIYEFNGLHSKSLYNSIFDGRF